jgi:DNA-directed RNA polymerase subunit K/omega
MIFFFKHIYINTTGGLKVDSLITIIDTAYMQALIIIQRCQNIQEGCDEPYNATLCMQKLTITAFLGKEEEKPSYES